MTPEEKSLLERTLKLSEENNVLLHGLRRANRLSLMLKVFYWVLILGLSFGALYFIKPFFAAITGGAFDQSVDGSSDGTSSFQSLQELLK